MDTMIAPAECRREPSAGDPLVEQIFPAVERLWDRPLPVARPGTSTWSSPSRHSGHGVHGRPYGSSHSGHPGGAPAWW
jgi:hypothetical protein